MAVILSRHHGDCHRLSISDERCPMTGKLVQDVGEVVQDVRSEHRDDY
jgi:hypothetical protein